MSQDDLPPAAQDDEEGEETYLSVDVVPESDPEDDETLQGLVADMHAEELQASSVDE